VSNEPKHQSAEYSRRALLRGVVTATSGIAVLATAIGETRTAEAQAKMTQQVVAYQPSPKNGEACSTCTQFEPPNACKIVEGVISPAGWCKLYVKKTS
jgi:hypothetical protein